MSTAVQEILKQILRLPEEQRAEFDSKLSRLEEEEWIALVPDILASDIHARPHLCSPAFIRGQFMRPRITL
jgi:hypothetical protein